MLATELPGEILRQAPRLLVTLLGSLERCLRLVDDGVAVLVHAPLVKRHKYQTVQSWHQRRIGAPIFCPDKTIGSRSMVVGPYCPTALCYGFFRKVLPAPSSDDNSHVVFMFRTAL